MTDHVENDTVVDVVDVVEVGTQPCREDGITKSILFVLLLTIPLLLFFLLLKKPSNVEMTTQVIV